MYIYNILFHNILEIRFGYISIYLLNYNYMHNNCYICLEPCWSYNSDNMYLVKSKHLYFECNCEVHSHKQCMQLWLIRNPICIICRSDAQIYKNRFLNLISTKWIIWIVANLGFIWYIYTAVLNDFNTKTCRDISI